MESIGHHTHHYIPEILKFRGYYGFGPAAAAAAKACASRNYDTNAHIKFIFDTAIDDLEWGP